MTTIINGSSPSVTFSDGTTQTTAGLPLTGGTVTGNVTATSFIPTSNTIPTAGIYLASANAVAISASSVQALLVNSGGQVSTPLNPAFTAQVNGSSDATYNTGANIPFSVTGYNNGSNYNTSTYQFTAPVAGVYFFTASLYLTNSSGFTGVYQFGFVKNGSFITFGGTDAVGVTNGSPNTNGGTVQKTVTWNINLAVGDTVAVQPRATSLRVYQGHCYFTGCLIG
jgi:hypothetical protein